MPKSFPATGPLSKATPCARPLHARYMRKGQGPGPQLALTALLCHPVQSDTGGSNLGTRTPRAEGPGCNHSEHPVTSKHV